MHAPVHWQGVKDERRLIEARTGVAAGIAAGATVFGYSPPEAGHDAPAALRAAGAIHIFNDMFQLPQLLG